MATNNSINLSASGIVSYNGSGTFAGRTITGTSNEIDLSNGDGTSGNPTVGIADNPTMPGTAHMIIPTGTTAQRSGTTAGQLRYDSDLAASQIYESSDWQNLIGTGKWKELDTQVGGGTVTSVALNGWTGSDYTKYLIVWNVDTNGADYVQVEFSFDGGSTYSANQYYTRIDNTTPSDASAATLIYGTTSASLNRKKGCIIFDSNPSSYGFFSGGFGDGSAQEGIVVGVSQEVDSLDGVRLSGGTNDLSLVDAQRYFTIFGLRR